MWTGARGRKAFTLVELLVVMGIIALLTGILMPTINAARQQARAVQCQMNLRQIGYGMRMYATDWRDALHSPPDQWRWITTTSPLQLIAANNPAAYWGVAYFPYLASNATVQIQGSDTVMLLDSARRVFTCPSATGMSPTSNNVTKKITDVTTPGSYGINFCVTGEYPGTTNKKLSTFPNASETILVQDAFEQRLEGSSTYSPYDDSAKMLSDFGSGNGNLLSWRPGGDLNTLYCGGSSELPLQNFYRHRQVCQVLWMDGHVSGIPKSDGHDVPAAWYWGKTSPYR